MYQSVVEHLLSGCCSMTSSSITFLHAGMGQALVRSGWTMLAVLGVNHAFSLAQTKELGPTTVTTLKMWPLPVLGLSPLVLTAASLLPLQVPLLAQLSLHGPLQAQLSSLQVIQFHTVYLDYSYN